MAAGRRSRRWLSGTSRWPTAHAAIHAQELAASYFIYDLWICVTKFSENGAEFLLHAVVCSTI